MNKEKKMTMKEFDDFLFETTVGQRVEQALSNQRQQILKEVEGLPFVAGGLSKAKFVELDEVKNIINKL